MNRTEGEKALKRYLKRSIGYSITILIGFLINGEISLGADINKELQIQELLKNIKFEKEELNEKLLELEKELAVVKNSKGSSIHILFSPTVEHRHAKKSNDNNFNNLINDWEESIKDEPNIDIPDIRDDVKPIVPDISNPLPNEDSIVKEPEFEFGGIGSIAVNDQLPDIDLSLSNLGLPIKEITDDEFNILTEDNISKPDVNLVEVDNTNLGNITQNIKTEITTPTLNNIVDLSNFFVGEITVDTPNVITPESFSLDTVKIKTGTSQQDTTTSYAQAGGNNNYVVKNYTRYVAPKNDEGENKKGFNIWINEGKINYDTDNNADSNRRDKLLELWNGEEKIILSYGKSGNDIIGHYIGSYNDNGNIPITTTYISDVVGKDVSVEGSWSLTYEGARYDTTTAEDYVRIFLSSSSKGLDESSSDRIKLTEFSGELNLVTTHNQDNGDFNGNLVGIEHQIWDTSDKYSILLNSGTITIGNRVRPILELDQDTVNKNMIGIMIDYAGSTYDTLNTNNTNQENNQTINSGEINIIQDNLGGNTNITHNNIGISFEENEEGNTSRATLKDEVYIGKINIGDGTTQNYGFRMGNIYNNSSTYFDETKIIGTVTGDKIYIENDDTRNEASETNIKTDGATQYVDYTSDIVVAGNQNVGMVVGKSLSGSAKGYTGADTGEVNPIANFENISIKVDGDQTIGFVRDKDYSDNNTNDMVITDSNLNNVRFGENATNSVLFRSEMYGITNDSELDVTIGNENTKATSNEYNVAMQATRQSWDKDGDGEKDINSSGSVTNGANATISGTVNNMIGMMASGNVEDKVTEWQNGEQASEALATNKGTISLDGDNNIGIAIMDDNKGNNSGTITITGDSGVGIYNTGTFENTGNVTVLGVNGIGIYNNNNNSSLTLKNSTINIGGENSVGIYSEGGTINFDSTTIIGTDNAIAGIYTNKANTSIKGNVSITGTKVGLVSNSVTTNVNGNLEYSGDGFALYTKGANGKIEFDSNSILTLGGNAYGFDIVDTTKQGETPKQYIDFNGATIEIKSNDVTLFNINGNGTEYASSSIDAGNSNLPGEKYLEQFVGNIGGINSNGYEGYKMASIENGNILLNSTTVNNEEFLKKYKFQKSKISMSTDTNLTLSNTEADTYFSGEVIGIGISSNTSKSDEEATALEDTQINIGSTLTANRTDVAPTVSSSTKSTIGAYIDYGVINIGYDYDFNGDGQSEYKEGHIVVENSNSTDDIINDNGIGIFSKNSSKVIVNEGSSITVYGDNGIGIYGEATKDGKNNQNKFGGTITQVEINNAGTIDVSSGVSGIGIFADSGEESVGKVNNSGTIKVGGGTVENSSIGIYGINTEITNTGSITVGSNINDKNSTGVGIYAQNSSVTLGEESASTEFTLGDGATGIYLDKDSTLTLNSDLVFNSLSDNTTDRIGIYAKGETGQTNTNIEINKNIDMSDVVGGKAVIVDGRSVELAENTTIKISGNNGRGIRVLNNGTITNNGNIDITSNGEIQNNPSSIGMVAANINGKIENTGTISVGSTNGIGIYVDNSNGNGNTITSIGNIKLKGDKNVGVVAKEFDLKLEENSLTTSGITFENSNGVGIYSENSNVTINEEISKTFNENQTNNILIASIGKDSQGTKVVTNNGEISLNGKSNIGIYLAGNTKYSNSIGNNTEGSIKISDGAIGIYADKGASVLENINITSDSKGNQTIGVILQGEDKEDKNISGEITLTNTNSNIVQGKNIGVYANNSNVVVNENEVLTLHNDGSNGTGLYLNDSTLSGSGTVKITGEGKVNSEGKISNSVGIYYTSTNKANPITSNNQIKVEIDKSNTIGVYVSEGNTLTKGSEGIITLGKDKAVTDVTGLVASTESTITNDGKVVLNEVTKGIGIASLGGATSDKETKINNNGTIEITENSISGTGIFLTGNSNLENTGTIIINENTTMTTSSGNKHLGIGIYTKGEDVTIGTTGTFDMVTGNVAIYSDGTNISSDIKLVDSNNLEKNSGTTALVVKSDKDSIDANITKGTLVGGTSEDKMEISLAKGSTGIYALDSGVEISNVSIDAKAHNQTSDELSYGIYLKSEANGDYKVSNTDISLVKGVGIIVDGVDNLQVTDKDTKLTLSGSTINIDSYSEGNASNAETDTKETGIGIYTDSGTVVLNGGNIINTSYGVGIFGGANSNIITSNGDKLNLQGYSVGVYSKGGDVTLGTGTEISFNNAINSSIDSGNYQGAGAYIIDGNITSAASITNGNSEREVVSEGLIGILGKQTVDKEMNITNTGNINLAGSSVIGIAGLGGATSKNMTITNDGNINISGVYSFEEGKASLSTGIYGENININSKGSITVGDYAMGIFYQGTANNEISSNEIVLSGADSIGAILTGEAKSVSINNIEGDVSKNRNLGVYLNNYSSIDTNIGNITLGDESLGVYINNSSTNSINLGDIKVGIEGIGIANIGDSKANDKVTITSNGSISVGDQGTAVYVKDSTLNMNSLANIEVGKGGTYIHVNNGILNLDQTVGELTFDGNIGMILENGGDITSKTGEVDTINIINGGTGILVKGTNTKRPEVLADNTTINLNSGVSTGINQNGIEEFDYTVGVYYQSADIISDTDLDIEYIEGAHHTIGTIYDRTYGTINNFGITMDNSISDSIGTIIRRDNYNEELDKNNNSNVTINAEQDKDLINVSGKHNIGLIAKNSIVTAIGNIKVGLDETSEGSIGVYLTGNNEEWQHSFNGTGDIEIGSYSYGIYAKNYDIIHNGNITVSGQESAGIASIVENNEDYKDTHIIELNNSNLFVKDGAIGVFGRGTEIDINNVKLNITGNNSTGIASIKNGNINFSGSAIISGKGSAGIYKNTVLDDINSSIKSKDDNMITVDKGEWIIDDTANGIMAISRDKNENGEIISSGSSITINNSSNMTLGNAAIGIYSAGANTVDNYGNIIVGGAVIDENETLTSIGMYIANGVGNTVSKGTNTGDIVVKNNGGVGIQVAGYVDFINKGNVDVANGGVGMQSSYGATITNKGEITVIGKGTGMIARGINSQAINDGTITLEMEETLVQNNDKLTYNDSLIGMGAYNGGSIINNGEINVNDGIGMYIDQESKLTNSGVINVNNGVGIIGVGKLANTGKIIVNSENPNAVGSLVLNEALSDSGSLVINRENGVLEVNDNFSNIGGILETELNIKLNNPTVDITAGGAGFNGSNISGDIKLDSNFALEGDGINYTVEDFIDPSANINVNTSPLFNTEIVEGDLTVNKIAYKEITDGDQYDNRDNSLDNILANGGVDADILKNLNYYLDSLGNTSIFSSEANSYLGAIGGNVYSNIQSRMQDINRVFDNSFEEMLASKNPTYENTKFHLIYTDGDYKNSNKNVINYNYDIKGLNYMKEYDLTSKGKKYGYTFGFTGSKFKFDNSFDSKEDIYSLRGGVHRVNYYDNGVSWLTKGEIGYNHHRINRKVTIPGADENIDNRVWYGSYQVSLDNKLRKEFSINEDSNIGVYTALNLEYGLFDDIKEKGNLALKVKSNDYFSSKVIIGTDGKLSKPLNNNWTIRLNGDINYSYDLGNNYDKNEVKFRNGGSYYSLASEIKSRDIISGKVSLSFDKSDYMSLSLHAQAAKDFRRDEDYWNVGVTFTYRFNDYAVPEKFLDMCNYFEFDKSELEFREKVKIKEMAEYIEQNDIKGVLLIEGHTDDIGRTTYNDNLSLKRANSVKNEFEKTLTNEKNIQIKVIGYGENKPKYKNINENTRSKNRRAEVSILNN